MYICSPEIEIGEHTASMIGRTSLQKAPNRSPSSYYIGPPLLRVTSILEHLHWRLKTTYSPSGDIASWSETVYSLQSGQQSRAAVIHGIHTVVTATTYVVHSGIGGSSRPSSACQAIIVAAATMRKDGKVNLYIGERSWMSPTSSRARVANVAVRAADTSCQRKSTVAGLPGPGGVRRDVP